MAYASGEGTYTTASPLENPNQHGANTSMQEPQDGSQEDEVGDEHDLPNDNLDDPAISEELSTKQAQKKMGKKPMQEEENEDTLSFPYSKRQKVNQTYVRNIPDTDLNLVRDTITKFIEKTLGHLVTRKTNWTAAITTKVNQLARTISEV